MTSTTSALCFPDGNGTHEAMKLVENRYHIYWLGIGGVHLYGIRFRQIERF
jgi:hypothetical protein